MATLVYNSNQQLKAANVPIQFTQEQIEEYVKCSKDPVYFINNYCKIVSLDHGLVPFRLYECQVEKVRVIHENRKVILMEGRQQGKCCSELTPIRLRNKKSGQILEITMGEFFENWVKK